MVLSKSFFSHHQIFIEPLALRKEDGLAYVLDDELEECFSRIERIHLLHTGIYKHAKEADSFAFLLSFLPFLKKVPHHNLNC